MRDPDRASTSFGPTAVADESGSAVMIRRRTLAVSGLLLNMLGAALLLSLSPTAIGTYADPNATLFIVWHRPIAVYASVAALFLGFLLQLIAALRE